MEKLRVFEAFSGYGSQSMALRNIGVPYEVVGISEIDKYAIQVYKSIQGEVNNLGDISKIQVENIPKHDLFTYSFPCQDISVAGKMEGIQRGQTRSGLLYECERIIEHCKPKYLLMENVKNLVGKKFINQFNQWLDYLKSLGYTNYWQVLNSKDYGVPQNRERVFVVSILGEHKPYEFPKRFKLDKNIKSLLEGNVADKYYLSDEMVKKFVPSKNFTTRTIKPTLKNGIDTNDSSKIIDVGFVKKSENGTKHQSNTVLDEDYLMRTLMASDYKSPQLITIKNKEITHQTICEQRTDEGLRFFKDDVCGAIRTANNGGDKRVIETEPSFRIRKVTPRECFRLMGVTDEDIDKIVNSGVSATQQYKMAGNSIVIQVLEGIFKNLFLS